MASANLTLFNQIAEAVGGEGGHSYNIDALNEIASELIGEAQSFTLNIDALNAIAENLSGESQSFMLNIDALNFIAEAAGGDEALDTWTVDALDEWLATGGGGVERLPAPGSPTAEDNGDGTFAYSFSAVDPTGHTLSRYEYSLNGGAYVSLLLATSGNITDAGYVVGSNTVRYRGYDAVVGVAGMASSTVTFERAAEAEGARLTEDGGTRLAEDGTTRIIE